MNIQYISVGDYLTPDFESQKEPCPIGRWGFAAPPEQEDNLTLWSDL